MNSSNFVKVWIPMLFISIYLYKFGFSISFFVILISRIKPSIYNAQILWSRRIVKLFIQLCLDFISRSSFNSKPPNMQYKQNQMKTKKIHLLRS